MADSAEAQQLESASDKELLAKHANMPRHAVPSSSTAPAATAPTGPTPQAGSHALRIAANPNLAGPAPMFVKQPMQQLAQPRHSTAKSGLSESNDTLNYGSVQPVNESMDEEEADDQAADAEPRGTRGKQKASAHRSSAKRSQNRPSRLQHDDPFLSYQQDIKVA